MPDAFQWTYTRSDGRTVTFGVGTDLIVRQVDGLDGYELLQSSTTPIPRGHGAVPGEHYLPPRYPTFRLLAAPSSVALAASQRDQVMAALAVSVDTDGTLEWIRDGMSGSRKVHCRPLSVSWPTDGSRSARLTDAVVVFEAADPRIYATATKQASLTPYTTAGGIDGPVDGAKDAAYVGSDVAVANAGNLGSPPMIRFYGPTSGTCTGVQLLNRTTGVTVDVQTDIVAGQILTVDMRAFVAATGGRIVDLSGANRYGSWQQTRQALLIEPGSNVLRFTGDGVTTGMRAVVDWSDCWSS